MEEIRENALENEIEKRCKGVLNHLVNGYERPALQLSASIAMPILGTCFIQ